MMGERPNAVGVCDVSIDGKKFLMVEPEASGLELVAVPSRRTELKRVIGGNKQ
jgi:hypothetical protein